MNTFLNKLKIVFKDPDLRKKILFVVLILALFRIGANIPIPGVNLEKLTAFLSGSQLFGMMNIFSGGGLSNMSIIMLGVGPYITATIIMQLLAMIFPSIKEMYQEGGEAGRKKFERYSRFLTVPLAMLQGFGLLSLLGNQQILMDIDFFSKITNVIIITAGSVLLMWLGELITEFGIGNGISILIFAGIVSSFPRVVVQALTIFDMSQAPVYLIGIVATVIVLAAVIAVSEAERLIPISYAKQIRGGKMYGGMSSNLPLKVNQAGVIPIIFAISLLLFPQMIASFLGGLQSGIAQSIAAFLTSLMSNGWVYGVLYFVLVFFFTYFYTMVTFDPHSLADNLQKSGAFVAGVRPGQPTADYVSRILNRITLVGAIFLGLIAVLPMMMQSITGNIGIAIGGTSLLIVVSVVLETLREVDSQITMREYE